MCSVPVVLCPVVRGNEHLSESDGTKLDNENSSLKRVMDKARDLEELGRTRSKSSGSIKSTQDHQLWNQTEEG